MKALVRFLAALTGLLALLSLAMHALLTRAQNSWLESDLALRADLAVAGAEQAIVGTWDRDPSRLTAVIEAIARDERIMGIAACRFDGSEVARSSALPASFVCAPDVDPARPSRTATVGGRAVHVATVPVADEGDEPGYLVLVHDLSFVEAREAATRNVALGAFFVLAVIASGLTLLATRWAWRRWTNEARAALLGDGASSSEFAALARDVRALAGELAEERARGGLAGPWDAQRLKTTLETTLRGESVIVLSNREPYIHARRGAVIEVQHPASGLVTALEPVMRACSGVWVAHGSGTADRDTVDARDRVRVPPGENSYSLRRVWLSDEEENGYYYGFANEGLWPLCHVAHARPSFRAEDWEHYVRVNRRFADAVCDEAVTDAPIVLVQDYHFALAPRFIRERCPRATILTFWHIPWPNAERMGICPFRTEIIEGLLGSDIVGFHTQQHCNNFLASADGALQCRIDRELHSVVLGERSTLVRSYPISIEWPGRWVEAAASVAACRADVRRTLGLPDDVLLGVGVDRLDYTKGIEERLLAVEDLLARNPSLRGRFAFVQLSAPSRSKIPHYRELSERVEVLAERINARWTTRGVRPIVLRVEHHEPSVVTTYYRAADVCYVSSLHDGMNLVAKEFVAAREDEQGVLVLSQFTGAARDLTESLIVNPYDTRRAADALAVALHMPAAEQRVRMRSMRRVVAEFNVYRWAGRMLLDAAEVRRRRELSEKLVGLGSAA